MAAVEDRFSDQRSKQDIAVANQRVLRRLAIAIKAGNGKLNLLVAVADRAVERDAWMGEYEIILSEKGMRGYRVKLDSRMPSLKQSLLDLQADGVALEKGEFVSVLGAAELLDLRLEKGERSSLEKLLFSLQWTREALRAFNCPIVLWVSNKVADALATASPDFWSWRGNGLFEFESERRAERVLQPVNLDLQGTVSVLKPRRADDDDSELGRKAAAQWEELEALLASEPDSPLLGSLYEGLGYTERKRGNLDSAETLLKRAIQLHRDANNRYGESSSIGILGDVERDSGNWDEAERLYRKALEMIEELGDRSGMATSWGSLGDIERNRGNWDEADRLYRQCLEIEQELGDRSGMASSWGVLGDIERNRGNWDEAERLYRQSLELRQELGDRSGMASSWGCLGDIERNRGNWDEAERLYRQSMTLSQELGATDLLAHNNFDFALLERTRGNSAQAEDYYATAHRLFTQLGAAKDLERIETEWAKP